jgi:transposase-like protein
MSPPNRESVAEIARSTGVNAHTLYSWRHRWKQDGLLVPATSKVGLSRFNGQVAKPPAQPIMDAMTRQRRRFTPQQKAEAIALCQNEGLTILEASNRLGIHPTCLGRWVRQAGIDAQGPTKAGPLSTSERDEMTRMRKEIRELRRERDFFKLAAAHFAKEQLSPKSINS